MKIVCWLNQLHVYIDSKNCFCDTKKHTVFTDYLIYPFLYSSISFVLKCFRKSFPIVSAYLYNSFEDEYVLMSASRAKTKSIPMLTVFLSVLTLVIYNKILASLVKS